MSNQIIQIKDGSDNVLPLNNVYGSTYCKFSDGTLIQWGNQSFTNASTSGYLTRTLSFNQAFLNTSYRIVCNPARNCIAYLTSPIFESDTGGNVQRTVTSTIISAKGSNANCNFDWLAIGRWK